MLDADQLVVVVALADCAGECAAGGVRRVDGRRVRRAERDPEREGAAAEGAAPSERAVRRQLSDGPRRRADMLVRSRPDGQEIGWENGRERLEQVRLTDAPSRECSVDRLVGHPQHSSVPGALHAAES